MKEVRAQVDRRAHQEAARAAALNGKTVRGRVALGDQVLGAGDEVGERVALAVHLARLAPVFAHLAAPSDMARATVTPRSSRLTRAEEKLTE